uniref:Uncharacterized protein n=1 Tax=Ficedula albicollis TaxID=59894 RepID=A0A803VTP8_FICAL
VTNMPLGQPRTTSVWIPEGSITTDKLEKHCHGNKLEFGIFQVLCDMMIAALGIFQRIKATQACICSSKWKISSMNITYPYVPFALLYSAPSHFKQYREKSLNANLIY